MNALTRIVVLDRDWSIYTKGTRFVVVEEISCGEVGQADGTTITPINMRVMLEGETIPDNMHMCRTIPAEYAAEMPNVCESYDVEANQGTRDGTVVATCGSQFLVEYEMPAGRTFGRIFDVLKPDWHRAVCMTNLPKRWQDAVNA